MRWSRTAGSRVAAAARSRGPARADDEAGAVEVARRARRHGHEAACDDALDGSAVVRRHDTGPGLRCPREGDGPDGAERPRAPRCRGPRRRPRRGDRRGGGLRGVPDRPPDRLGRHRDAKATRDPRAPGRRADRGNRRAGRPGVAGRRLRPVPGVPRRPGEPVRAGRVPRVDCRRRLRRAGRRPARPHVRPARRHGRHRGCAAPLRRDHRVPLASALRDPARRPPRALRLRVIGPPRHPGRPPLGLRGVRLLALSGRARPRPRARRGLGGRLRRPTARAARCRGHVRARRVGGRRGAPHARPGGTVAVNAIHLDGIPAFDYDLLWRERVLRSVANFTRADATEFLALAAEIPSGPSRRRSRSPRRPKPSPALRRARFRARLCFSWPSSGTWRTLAGRGSRCAGSRRPRGGCPSIPCR